MSQRPHKFSVGQAVEILRTVLRLKTVGAYQICALVPAEEQNPQEPRYRIRSIAEKFERIVPESDLNLSRSSKPLSG
jgi:hypothetical protein